MLIRIKMTLMSNTLCGLLYSVVTLSGAVLRGWCQHISASMIL